MDEFLRYLRKPWNDDSPASTNKQWFLMVSKWCEMVFVHPRYQGKSIRSQFLSRRLEVDRLSGAASPLRRGGEFFCLGPVPGWGPSAPTCRRVCWYSFFWRVFICVKENPSDEYHHFGGPPGRLRNGWWAYMLSNGSPGKNHHPCWFPF